MHSVLRESIKSWTAGKAEKSTPLDDIGDAKFYDLTFLRDMAKGTVEAGSHNPQEYTFVELRGLSDHVILPCHDNKEANVMMYKLMTYKADLTKNTYLVLKSDGLIDFIQIDRVDL